MKLSYLPNIPFGNEKVTVETFEGKPGEPDNAMGLLKKHKGLLKKIHHK